LLAVRHIFEVKGRPNTNPLICHVANQTVAKRYAREWPREARQLAEKFWPGALTIVVHKSRLIVDDATAGLDSVGLRVPNHKLALALLRAFAGPIAAPSANRSTHVSPTLARHVYDELGDDVDMVLDGGACMIGIESTVLDLTAPVPTILRPGSVSRERIQKVIGPVDLHSAAIDEAKPARSPGQQHVHYAPTTPAYRFDPRDRNRLEMDNAAVVELTLDPETYARNLYARLRLLDTQNLRAIYVEMPPDLSEWTAVRDRLMRATKPLTA
jgi:L-threonylcarbamoyladenylate synthase